MVEDDNLIQLPRDDGAGFCRLSAENCSLERSFEVTLIDCYSYHRFQPLLYQVATAAVTLGPVHRRCVLIVSPDRACRSG